jgi:hypothetical protein
MCPAQLAAVHQCLQVAQLHSTSQLAVVLVTLAMTLFQNFVQQMSPVTMPWMLLTCLRSSDPGVKWVTVLSGLLAIVLHFQMVTAQLM